MNLLFVKLINVVIMKILDFVWGCDPHPDGGSDGPDGDVLPRAVP